MITKTLLLKISFAIILLAGITTYPIGDIHSESVLNIEVEKGTQRGKDYAIPITIHILSSIDSDRFQLNMDIPDGLKPISKTDVFTQIKKDIKYEQTYYVVPQKPGNYKVFVEGQLWQADTNYKAIDSTDLTINDKLELEPVSDSFKKERKIASIFNFFKNIVLIGIVLFILGYIAIQFKRWLDAEDRMKKRKRKLRKA